MDRYEIKIKSDEINKYLNSGDYESAVSAADQINWGKETNPGLLCDIAEIYVSVEKNFEAKEILHKAYEISSNSRRVIYDLAVISIKLDEPENVERYYDEFIAVAGDDSEKYLLEYEILLYNDAPLEEIAEVLEKYKQMEFTEELYEIIFSLNEEDLEKLKEEVEKLESSIK